MAHVAHHGTPRRSATPTRDRERLELLRLRQEVTDLSGVLAQLSASRASRSPASKSSGRVAVWRHIARSSEGLKAESENENRRLRRAVEDYVQVLEDVKSRLVGAQRGHRNEPKQNHQVLTDGDCVLLELLVAELDMAFAQVDDVLPAGARLEARDEVKRAYYTLTRHDLMDESETSAVLVNNPSPPPLVVLEDERELPFEFENVGDAVWHAWVKWLMKGSCSAGGMWTEPSTHGIDDRPEQTFAIKARLLSSAAESRKDMSWLNIKLAVRKYTTAQPERLVLVWRGLSEGELGYDGLYTDETSWITVERTSEGAVMRSYVKMTPMLFEETDFSRQHSVDEIQRFTDLVIRSYMDDVALIYQEVESLLLRQSAQVRFHNPSRHARTLN